MTFPGYTGYGNPQMMYGIPYGQGYGTPYGASYGTSARYSPYQKLQNPMETYAPNSKGFGSASVAVPGLDTQRNNHPVLRSLGLALAAPAAAYGVAQSAGYDLYPATLAGLALAGGLGGWLANKKAQSSDIKNQDQMRGLALQNNAAFGQWRNNLIDQANNQRDTLTMGKAMPFDASPYTNQEDATGAYNQYIEYLKNSQNRLTNNMTNDNTHHVIENPTYSHVPGTPPGATEGTPAPAAGGTTSTGTPSEGTTISTGIETEYRQNPLENRSWQDILHDPYSWVDPNTNVSAENAASTRAKVPSEVNQNNASAANSQATADLNRSRKVTEDATRQPKIQKIQSEIYRNYHPNPSNPNETGTFLSWEKTRQVPVGAAAAMMNASQLTQAKLIPITAPGIDANTINPAEMQRGNYKGQSGWFNSRTKQFYNDSELNILTIGGKKGGSASAPPRPQ